MEVGILQEYFAVILVLKSIKLIKAKDQSQIGFGIIGPDRGGGGGVRY